MSSGDEIIVSSENADKLKCDTQGNVSVLAIISYNSFLRVFLILDLVS